MYQAKYLDDVVNDIIEAKKWYKEQQEGLEEKFAKQIEDAIKNLLKMPTAYQIRYRNIRIAHPKIFPYNIHFYVDDNQQMVVITGVVFNKRKDALHLKR